MSGKKKKQTKRQKSNQSTVKKNTKKVIDKVEKEEKVLNSKEVKNKEEIILDDNKLNEENNKEDRKYSIISFFIALLIVGGLICFLIINFDKKNQSFDKKLNAKSVDKLAEELYYSISSKRNVESNELIFFKESNVNYSNISNDDILYIAYSELSKEDKSSQGEQKDSCYISSKDSINSYDSNCFIETIDKNVLNEQVGNYFTKKVKVNYVDFRNSSNQMCYLSNNTYKCYLNRGSSIINNYKTINKYDTYEFDRDTLVVFSYLLTLRDSYDKDYEEGIYMDSKATKRIDNLDYYTNELKRSATLENMNKLVDRYKDKASRYKSTFVKENDNYVWLSTEKVK